MVRYFDRHGKLREVGYWAAATQQQLERWEPLVAECVLRSFKKEDLGGVLAWRTHLERHFTVIAADHLITAVKFVQFAVQPPELMATEIEGGRDALEHWQDNMKVFMVEPREFEPKYASVKAFADLNPVSDPYDGFAWDNTAGPKLFPHVPASELRAFVDRVKVRLVAEQPGFAPFFQDWAPSAWLGGDNPNERWLPVRRDG
jgi:hypothetical protein